MRGQRISLFNLRYKRISKFSSEINNNSFQLLTLKLTTRLETQGFPKQKIHYNKIYSRQGTAFLTWSESKAVRNSNSRKNLGDTRFTDKCKI